MFTHTRAHAQTHTLCERNQRTDDQCGQAQAGSQKALASKHLIRPSKHTHTHTHTHARTHKHTHTHTNNPVIWSNHSYLCLSMPSETLKGEEDIMLLVPHFKIFCVSLPNSLIPGTYSLANSVTPAHSDSWTARGQRIRTSLRCTHLHLFTARSSFASFLLHRSNSWPWARAWILVSAASTRKPPY